MTAAALDSLFRDAVAAIDAGDAQALERLLQQHPELVRERLTEPGDWVRNQIGQALKGFFKDPYLMWFVTEDAVRGVVDQLRKLPQVLSRVFETWDEIRALWTKSQPISIP